jgi:phage terminase small subunit
MVAHKDLTPKQEAFAQAYVETGSPAESYRAAYDASAMQLMTIRVKASELLAHPMVAARVKELRAARQALLDDRFIAMKERVIHEYARIAFANMLDYVTVQDDGTAYVDLSAISREEAAAIGSVEVEEYTEGRGEDGRPVKRVKFKLLDKRGALADLGKHLGMFTDKVEHTGKDGAPLLPENSASPRDLARAIMDIFRSAATENKDDPQ